MLFKKVGNNSLSLELNNPFDFQLRTQSVSLSFVNSNVSSVG